MGRIGTVGIIALLINSILSRKEPTSYDGFLVGVSSFFVTYGINAGIHVVKLEHSLTLGLLVGTGESKRSFTS